MNTAAASADHVRILVVDDHTLFRRGLTALLGRDPRHKVVGDAADASQAHRRAMELQPDLILLDNHLPGVRGVDAIAGLKETALRNGASGYLLKTMEGDALTRAINLAMTGENVIAPEMTGKLVNVYRNAAAGTADAAGPPVATSPLALLTPRELDILRAMTAGASNKEIARQFAIAETTVKIHVQHILRKLDVTTRVHAAVMASESGLL